MPGRSPLSSTKHPRPETRDVSPIRPTERPRFIPASLSIPNRPSCRIGFPTKLLGRANCLRTSHDRLRHVSHGEALRDASLRRTIDSIANPARNPRRSDQAPRTQWGQDTRQASERGSSRRSHRQAPRRASPQARARHHPRLQQGVQV